MYALQMADARSHKTSAVNHTRRLSQRKCKLHRMIKKVKSRLRRVIAILACISKSNTKLLLVYTTSRVLMNGIALTTKPHEAS